MQQTTTAAAGKAAEGQATDQASQFSQLPPALLTRILQSLPQRDRLGCCATVCKSWAEAATAATVEVDVPDDRYAELARQRIAAFQPWLEQHAGQLVSLRVQDLNGLRGTKAELHLPCRKLQQLSRLDLGGLQVHSTLAAGSSSNSNSYGGASMLDKLQELRLFSCKLSCSTLLQLAQLSGVAHFEYTPQSELEAVKHLLPGMPNLEWLHLAGQLGATDIMAILPAHSLTALTVDFDTAYSWRADGTHMQDPVKLRLVKLPDSASRLVNLRELKLSAGLNPVALASMTLLTKLELAHCQPAAGADGTSGSLAAVRGMCKLQHLEVLNFCEALLRAAEPRACAALTASSQLTYLEIRSQHGQPLPATALQHMFPAGKQLPHLQHLVICCPDRNSKDAGHITAAELSSLVDACPALICLDLRRVLAQDVDVSALLSSAAVKLPQQCQHMWVGGQAFDDKAAGVIAQLTQLTRLWWTESPGLTDAGLAQLTALHALDTLLVRNASAGSYRRPLFVQTKAGGQSVSQRLCELLLAAPSSGPWKQQLQEQQDKLADMQDRLQKQQEEITTVQDRLCELSCST